jgi:IS4 transposase
VRYHLDTPGFRTRQITLVTTLLAPEVYHVADLAKLYRQRWQVETSLAHLKTTMQMDVLHGKTVPGVLKELTVFALVYNLVRMVAYLALADIIPGPPPSRLRRLTQPVMSPPNRFSTPRLPRI